MLPVLGPSASTPALFHAFEFSGHGFQLGPGVGAVLAELALDGETKTPIAEFKFDRFRSDSSLELSVGQTPVTGQAHASFVNIARREKNRKAGR
jgi:sarcosine oxidase subunit beta